MAFGIRKYAVRTQIRDASAKAPRRLSLVQQKRIGSGVKAPSAAKSAEGRLKNLVRGSKLKKSARG